MHKCNTYRNSALSHPQCLKATPTAPSIETMTRRPCPASPLLPPRPRVQLHRALNQGLVRQLSTAVNTSTSWSLRKAQRNVFTLSSCRRYLLQRLFHLLENRHPLNCGRQHLSQNLLLPPCHLCQACVGSMQILKWAVQWTWTYQLIPWSRPPRWVEGSGKPPYWTTNCLSNLARWATAYRERALPSARSPVRVKDGKRRACYTPTFCHRHLY